MYWKKLLGIKTLSWTVGSIRLRPEWPWRARRYKIVLDESVQYWYLFLFPPPPAMLFFHLSSDQWGQHGKCFWRLSLILQNSTAPSLSRGTCFPWRRRWINIFDMSWSESEYSLGSTSVQVLFPIGIVLGKEPASSLLCGFALAFDRHAKSFTSNFNAYSSSCISEVSCSMLFKFITNFFCSMRNSDPRVRIVSVHRHSSDLNSVLNVQATGCNFQYGPNFGVPFYPSFWLWRFFVSWQSVFTRQATARNCENSAMSFVMKYCPISTTVSNPASIQNLLKLSCCDRFSIRSPYCCNRRSSWARSSQSKGTTVLITLGTNEELDCPPHNGSLRSVVKRFIFFTHFCDCSVNTELIYRNNSFNRFQIGCIVYRQFSMSFAFESTSGQWARSPENWVSAFCEFQHYPFRHMVPFSLWIVFVSRIPLLFRTRTTKWPLSCSKSFCI